MGKRTLCLALAAVLLLAVPGAAAVTYRQGSTGAQVRTIQDKLKRWGYYSGEVDGIFGSGTRKAVVAFQKKNGLTADGIVGPNTLRALGMPVSGSGSVSSATATSSWIWSRPLIKVIGKHRFCS